MAAAFRALESLEKVSRFGDWVVKQVVYINAVGVLGCLWVL